MTINEYQRLGCIGCPLAGPKKQRKEFESWQKYYDNYLRAFARMIERRPPNKAQKFTDAQAAMDWWLNEKGEKPLKGQIRMWEGDEDAAFDD